MQNDGWTALILAGERPGGDPLAENCSVASKALIPIDGRAMIDHVACALDDCDNVARITILAQKNHDAMRMALSTSDLREKVTIVCSQSGIADSIRSVAETMPDCWPLLVTTADNPLLTKARLDIFLGGATTGDITIGVGERKIVEAKFPDTKRTWLKFRNGHYSGANLFAFRSAECLPALKHWAAIEQDRKKGLKLLSSFGLWTLLRSMTRTITFAEALTRAGCVMGVSARHVVLDAEAPIDVDNPDDLALVRAIMVARKQQEPRFKT